METTVRRLSPPGLALLKEFEQGPRGTFAAEPYDDGYGIQTIGWGHRLLRGESFTRPITRDLADAMLFQDLRRPERAVSTLGLPYELAPHQFDALVLFAFNLGVQALLDSTLLKILRLPKPLSSTVAKQWLRWVYAGRPPVRVDGLVIRRACELLLFQGAELGDIQAEKRRLETLAAKGSL